MGETKKMDSGVDLRLHVLLKSFCRFFGFFRFPLFSQKPNGVFLFKF